jgi:O-acetyl-ADP-ribose deacetylase (regulator of RNase III)
MKISVLAGDLADADADALCTSTNPRLSLMMGTGASVRERGGFEVLRACEAIVNHHGSPLPAGSVHPTTAGALRHWMIIHCVASDNAHHSAPDVVVACVLNAIAVAEGAQCRSIAMPVFASGHAHVRFDVAVRSMANALQTVYTDLKITVVVNDRDRAEEAQLLLRRLLGVDVGLEVSEHREAELVSMWEEV